MLDSLTHVSSHIPTRKSLKRGKREGGDERFRFCVRCMSFEWAVFHLNVR